MAIPYFRLVCSNDADTSNVYTLSLHDALPIFRGSRATATLPVVMVTALDPAQERVKGIEAGADDFLSKRSEEHTSELQSHHDLVCRLLLEKKNICLTLLQAHIYISSHTNAITQ